MLLGDAVQASKHDGQHLVDVLLNQTQDVLVIPEVQCPLCHLHTHTHSQLGHVHSTATQDYIEALTLLHCHTYEVTDS